MTLAPGTLLRASRPEASDFDTAGEHYVLRRGDRATVVSSAQKPSGGGFFSTEVTLRLADGRETTFDSLLISDEWTGNFVSEAGYAAGVPSWLSRVEARRAKKAAK